MIINPIQHSAGFYDGDDGVYVDGVAQQHSIVLHSSQLQHQAQARGDRPASGGVTALSATRGMWRAGAMYVGVAFVTTELAITVFLFSPASFGVDRDIYFVSAGNDAVAGWKAYVPPRTILWAFVARVHFKLCRLRIHM